MARDLTMKKKVSAPATTAIPATPSTTAIQAAPVLPYQPGSIVFTDREKADLGIIGYKAGDPIPGNLAEKIAAAKANEAAKAEMEASTRETINKIAASGLPATSMPRVIDLKDLPKAKQDELVKEMEKAKIDIDWVKMQQEEAALLGGMDPSLQAIIRAAKGDDSAGMAKSPEQMAAEAATAGPSEPPEPEAPDTHQHTGLEQCPRCKLVLSKPYEVEASRSDKMIYQIYFAGGPPFIKEYKLLGGSMTVYYRALEQWHSDVIFQQLQIDGRNGLIQRDIDWHRLCFGYRLVCSLHRLLAHAPHNISEDVDKWLLDASLVDAKEGDTALPGIIDKLTSTSPMNRESTWRVLGVMYSQFQELVDHLDVKTQDPSFWAAIEA